MLEKSYGSTMMTTPSGHGIIVIGGYNSEWKLSKNIFELHSRNNILYWTQLRQKLHHGRVGHVSLPVPDKFIRIITTHR